MSNFTSDRLEGDDSRRFVAQASLLSFILCAGIPPNLASFCVALRNHLTHPKRLFLLQIHRSLADTLLVLCFVAFKLANEIHAINRELQVPWQTTRFGCKAHKYLTTFTYVLSTNIILCIAVDRLSVVREIRSGTLVHKVSSLKFFIALAWLAALILSAPSAIVRDIRLYTNDSYCTFVWLKQQSFDNLARYTELMPQEEQIYVVFHLSILYIIPTVILGAIYCRVWLSLRRYDGRHREGVAKPSDVTAEDGDRSLIPMSLNVRPTATTTGTEANGNQRPVSPLLGAPASRPWRGQIASRKAMRKSVLITLAYILMWLPYCVLSLWQIADRESYVRYIDMGIAYHFIAFNSVINPWLYGIPYKCSCTRRMRSICSQ